MTVFKYCTNDTSCLTLYSVSSFESVVPGDTTHFIWKRTC